MSSSSHLESFLETPIRSFSKLWLPVLFSLVAEPLTGLVDTAFVSRLGAEELAALGVGTVVLTSGLWLFNFLSVGSQTEVSQAYGRKDLEQGKKIGSLALTVGGVVGLCLSLLMFAWAPALSSAMGATDQVHEHALTYIRIRVAGGPAVLVSMVSFGILYGLADVRTPLMVALAVNGLNIVLDALLIFGLGPFPALGIGGAALASTVSQWMGALWCGVAVYQKLGLTVHYDAADLNKLLAIGRDMFIRTGSLILFLLLATRSATRLGPEAGAAHQAVRQAWMFTNLFLDASAITAQSVVGYFYGSARIEEARAVAVKICGWSLLSGTLLLLVMYGATGPISVALVPASGLQFFWPAWYVAAFLQPLAALAFVTDGIHWGTGDFSFLRNVVLISTLSGGSVLIALEYAGVLNLTLVWWCVGLWILIRAGLGMYRLWPGMSKSPLRKS